MPERRELSALKLNFKMKYDEDIREISLDIDLESIPNLIVDFRNMILVLDQWQKEQIGE